MNRALRVSGGLLLLYLAGVLLALPLLLSPWVGVPAQFAGLVMGSVWGPSVYRWIWRGR